MSNFQEVFNQLEHTDVSKIALVGKNGYAS